MGNLLYIIAVILIIAWAIGFIGFNEGGIIHVLLIVAVVGIIIKLFLTRRRGRKFF
ncbi:MAG: lmo0937 family membrane protein [Prolixibacteraceae bacterium]